MTVRPLDAVLAIVAIGALIAAIGTGRTALRFMYAEEVVPQNVVPAGHTISGDVNTDKFVVAGPRATHAQCAP